MKGVVFSLKRESHRLKNEKFKTMRSFSVKQLLTQYGVFLFYILFFIFGIIYGSISFKNISLEFLEKLDLLFLTNLKNRLELSAFEVFSSSFASGFLFVFTAFLLSFTAWGIVCLPFLCAFKGYGVGLLCAFLFSEYSVSGLGFFILVILPGTVLFLFAFLLALKESLSHSLIVLKMYFPTFADALLLRHLKPFFMRYFIVIIFVMLSSVFDMILWVLFANLFNFK